MYNSRTIENEFARISTYNSIFDVFGEAHLYLL